MTCKLTGNNQRNHLSRNAKITRKRITQPHTAAIACKLLKKYFTFNISCNCCEDCEDFNCDECECGNYLDDIDFSDLDVEVEDVADDAE